MAIYYCSAKVIGRSGGRSATGAAAYRAGEKIKDRKSGLTFDYSRKGGVDHKEVIAPEDAPGWASERTELWNEVEASEKRRDAQLAREIVVSLPRELSARENLNLVSMFSRVNFVDRGMVADVTVHHAGSKNPHAHILLTTREIGPEGFGKKNRDWNRKELLQEWRSEWSRHANKALELAGREERIDHRTLEAQRAEALRKGDAKKVIALDREPVVSMDRASLRQESAGQRTKLGERQRQALSRNATRSRFWELVTGVNYAALAANPFVKTILDFQRWLFESGQKGGVEKRRAVAMERVEQQRAHSAEKGQEKMARQGSEAATREQSWKERQTQRGESAEREQTPAKEHERQKAGAETPEHAEEKALGTVPEGDTAKAERDARIMKELAETDLAALDEALQIREAEKILQERAQAREEDRARTKEKEHERDTGMEM